MPPSRIMTTLRVPVKQLRRTCDPRTFKFRTTADLPPLEGTVGQERAVSAMEFALDIEAEGFNLFVSGPVGTGRQAFTHDPSGNLVELHQPALA